MILNVVLDNTFCNELVNKIVENQSSDAFFNVSLNKTFKYLNKEFVKSIDLSELKTLSKSGEFSSVVVHYLNTNNLKLIKEIPSDMKICWVFYGADIFGHSKFNKLFLTSKTRQITYFRFDKLFFDKLLWRLKNKVRLLYALKRIDYVAMWIDGDYDLLKQETQAKNIIHIPFCYPARLHNFENSNIKKELEKKRLLIGNNGFATNNHLDGIDYVIKNKLETEYEVFILCIPNVGTYLKKVKEYAIEKLNTKVTFIEEKLSYDSFLSFCAEVDIAIFPHLRSQGGVTTRSLLYYGKTIVSFDYSNMTKKLKKLGCTFLNIDEDFRLLTETEKSNNKRIIKKHFGESGQSTSINNLIKHLR